MVFFINGDKAEKKIPEEVKLYLRIKEKTISDTIQFNGDFEQAVEQIIKGFDNYKLNMIFQRDQELNKTISTSVRNICRKICVHLFSLYKRRLILLTKWIVTIMRMIFLNV